MTINVTILIASGEAGAFPASLRRRVINSKAQLIRLTLNRTALLLTYGDANVRI